MHELFDQELSTPPQTAELVPRPIQPCSSLLVLYCCLRRPLRGEEGWFDLGTLAADCNGRHN